VAEQPAVAVRDGRFRQPERAGRVDEPAAADECPRTNGRGSQEIDRQLRGRHAPSGGRTSKHGSSQRHIGEECQRARKEDTRARLPPRARRHRRACRPQTDLGRPQTSKPGDGWIGQPMLDEGPEHVQAGQPAYLGTPERPSCRLPQRDGIRNVGHDTTS